MFARGIHKAIKSAAANISRPKILILFCIFDFLLSETLEGTSVQELRGDKPDPIARSSGMGGKKVGSYLRIRTGPQPTPKPYSGQEKDL